MSGDGDDDSTTNDGHNDVPEASSTVPRWSLLSEAPPGTTGGDQKTYLFERMTRSSLLTDNGDPQSSAPALFHNRLNMSAGHQSILLEVLDSEGALLDDYVERYFAHIHPSLPFLDEKEVKLTLRLLQSRELRNPSKELILCMVLSVGACYSAPANFRTIYHSRNFFLYTLELLNSCVHKEDIDTARAIILFTIYSLIHSSSGNSWHLRGLATRICITLGFHHESSLRGDSSVGEEEIEHRRHIFWCTYVLDRYQLIPEQLILVTDSSHLDGSA